MLDVRPVAYVVPIAEQEFASLTPLIRIANAGDENATLTGLVRIYRVSTGLLIYSSELAITEILAGASADVAALSPWSPPAPADDDYQIVVNCNAVSHPPEGWHTLSTSLPAYTFDIKPVGMGPAPAAHHATHENGGSDELNVTDLSGLLADPQTPLPHAADHAAGASDPLDHGTLPGLADDDHPQYRLRHELLFVDDFLHAFVAVAWYPDAPAAGGTSGSLAGSILHPGILRYTSSVNANSGRRNLLNLNSILLSGGALSTCWHRPQTLAGTTRHHGFHDANGPTDPVDGAWIWQDPATGIIYGRTRNNSVGSTTGTGYQLVTNTWYFEKIVVNANATRVDYYLYDEAGALLWTDFLTTNIPTAAGRELGHGFVVTNSGTTAVALDDLDYLSLLIPDRRPNV